MNIFTDD